jgi:choline dehydrogenase-like flavoprotein
MNYDIYDICIIGSGAGAGPIIYELSKKGLTVCVLEKGDIYNEKDFSKDEIAVVRRPIYTPNLKDEYHTIEEFMDGTWEKFPTYETGWSFWNGNLLGGSSNFMSGYFHRLKPNDFKLASVYGVPKDSNIVDWPISYSDMEKYYEKVERYVGVSGEIQKYEFMEPRSTKDFPYPALEENKIVKLIDKACGELKYKTIKTPRAILSKPKNNRNACYYSNYCGSYACSSGGKGSSRASLIKDALLTNKVTIIPNAFVIKLNTNKDKKIESVTYLTKEEKKKNIKAKLFVIAAQAVETSRLLLNSKDENFPNGVANNSGNVGKNFLSSSGGIVSATFDETNMDLKDLLASGLFVNRSLMDWYYTKDFKGGAVDILFEHANPIRRASFSRLDENGDLLIGEQLQNSMYNTFTKTRTLNMEIFGDWTPNDNAFISVDEKYKDKYGIPVANIRIGSHDQDLKAANFIKEKAIEIFEKMGGKNIVSDISALPSSNLQAGGCRFGDNPKTSVLNKYCQAHEVSNLFVTDGSFMPTGGSVPFTWTIYANSFRVADYIKENFENIII